MRTKSVLVGAAACFMLVGVAACTSSPPVSESAADSSVIPSTTIAPPPTFTTTPVTVPPLTTTMIVPSTTKPPTTTTHAAPPPPAAGPVTVPASRIHVLGGMSRPQDVKASGKIVSFVVGQAGCQQVAAHATAQSGSAVTIEVITTNTRRGTQVCSMMVREVPIAVALSAPLGNRTLTFIGVLKRLG